MGDLFDRYGVKPPAKTPDLFDRYGVKPPAPPADMPANASGVQDWEPTATRHMQGVELPKDEAAGWATTRIRNVAAGIAGFPRAVSDLVTAAGNVAGVDPAYWAGGVRAAFPAAMIGQFTPSTKEITDAVSPYLPTVNAPGKVGKVVDAAAEGAIGGIAMGGGAANILPSVVGGATSELAGQAVEGSPWEPAVRVLGGMLGGGLTAFGQNALSTIAQGYRNFKTPNTDAATGKILEKAAARDKMTVEEVLARQKALGEGATFAEAGGPNVRGAVRGSIAAPGEARTNVANAFENRIGQVDDQVTKTLDDTISKNGSLATTVDDLARQRAAASGPAYEAAGIPQTRRDLPNADRIMMSDDLIALFKDSPDVQAALRNARKVPELKDQPVNSMAVLDRVYKHLGGLEEAAVRTGNGTRAGDIRNIRQRVGQAIGDENSNYTTALGTYAEPSKLIDAATLGRDWFAKNVDPAVVKRQFAAMTPDEQQSALIGVRDWARDVAGRSDRATVAERVWTSENNRQRFQALLDTPGFEKLSGTMDMAKNAARTTRDIGVGSRTAPMLNEQADNALQMGPAVALAQGKPVNAAVQYGQNLLAKLTEGQTEAVNARLAEIATLTDPNKVGLVVAAANKAKLEAAARAADRSAFWGGAAIPTFNALVGR